MSSLLTSDEQLQDDTGVFEESAIYCANCENCILFKKIDDKDSNIYYLRVKCAAQQWHKKNGGEKVYKYFTVARRKVDKCSYYEPMGDAKEFLKELRKALPITDESYNIISNPSS